MARKKEKTMAIDTEELTNGTATENDTTATNDADTDDDENPTTEKAKRERVDLESLDANERVMLTISVPAGLKLALMKAGENDKLAGSAFARNVLAERMEYEIPTSFTERTRSSKYASEDERKAEVARKGKEDRQKIKALLAALKSNPALAAQLGADLP